MSKGKYEDMLDLPHPVSKKHPRMTMQERAAQFAPFAALTGHGAAIERTARAQEESMEEAALYGFGEEEFLDD
ncbi:MAG: hypothetical protein IJR36_07955 [Lachnospiraceae bacterium]|nr:hypothetical protein [Lachnospiraceae bacterium]MBQ9563137.1 hypothetical protein [Lachnospiraceae bacterium]MBQ9593791.1 hypothetical protein [Lachnospiraceae bacterium]MBR0153219.1 hypothetical protein [Lachnospiraceae bacterium]